MKKLSIFFALISIALIAVACENGNNNELPNKPVQNTCFKGQLTVDQNDGTFYNQSDVEVDYELWEDGKLNFVMYKVKFASGMPIKLDMVVEGVNYSEEIGGYRLSGEGIVPYAMGGPFEQFTITKLTGAITESEMTLDFMCGEYPVIYRGAK